MLRRGDTGGLFREGGKVDAELVVNRGLTAEDVADIQEAFRALGLATSARVAPRLRGQELSWLVLASLPLSGFLTTLGTSMAEDAYTRLKGLVRRVLLRGQGASGNTGALLLEDRATGALVVMDVDLPDEAYSALFATDLSVGSGATFRYDATHHRWAAS